MTGTGLARWRSFSRAAVLGFVVVLGGAGGCFKSPDVSHLECLDTAHCPSGYSCVVSQPGSLGLCVKGVASLDAASAEIPAPLDAASAEIPASLDASAVRDEDGRPDLVSVDQSSPSDSAVLDGQPPDSMAATEHDAMMDAPIAPADAAPNDAPDAAAEAGGPTSDARPDAQPDSSGKVRGTACTSNTECADGVCADGYCCDSACTGTCQACDITPGKCTTLGADATPRPSHGACAAKDAVCAGRCNGVSSACSYPTVACGTASCTGTTYNPAGTCSEGACKMPQSQTCPTNQTCSGNACACVAPRLSCSGSCIDPAGDQYNCGSCGHDCQGGVCLQGRCQPVVIAGNLGGAAQVFGVDSQYLYYSFNGGPMINETYRIAKTAVNGTGSFLVEYSIPGQGIIGDTILFVVGPFGFQPTCSVADCLSTLGELPLRYASSVDFRSPAPQYFAQVVSDPTLTITWYRPGESTPVATYTDTTAPLYYADSGFFAYGKMVYWIRDVLTAEGSLTGRVLYALDSTTMARSQLAGGMSSDVQIADANAISLLLRNSSNGDLYRILLPFGSGASEPPPLLLSAASVQSVTEATTGIYWADTTGTIYRCSANDCAGTKAILTNGQVTYALYQDDTFLYWGTASPNQIVRLVK